MSRAIRSRHQRRIGIAYGKIMHSFGGGPVEALHDHVWLMPFMEDGIPNFECTIGADHVVFGSDWRYSFRLGSNAD
jgi:hypothetical protein